MDRDSLSSAPNCLLSSSLSMVLILDEPSVVFNKCSRKCAPRSLFGKCSEMLALHNMKLNFLARTYRPTFVLSTGHFSSNFRNLLYWTDIIPSDP